jgi:hypothetical protein
MRNCYTNVASVHVLKVIDLLLIDIHHMLQRFCVKFVFLCTTLVVYVTLIIARFCIIVALMQLVSMFWKSSTFCWQLFKICCNFFV